MTDKRFEVTFNDSDFHLKDNETGEELKLVDEKVCYDYIADRWNALHETNERLRKAVDNCQFRTLDLLDYIKEKKTVTHQEIKDWWNSEVME